MDTLEAFPVYQSENLPYTLTEESYVEYSETDQVTVDFSITYPQIEGIDNADELDMRTINLNLRDGTMYQNFSDIVNVDDTFQSFWYDRMLAEVPHSLVLNGLTQEQFRRMLDGEVVDGTYYVNYFLTADGFELGFTYHYNSGEEHTAIQRGWMSAPCLDIDMYGFSKESEFWELLE